MRNTELRETKMRNVILILAPSLIACLCSIGAIINESIKRKKYYWVRIIVFIFIFVFLIVTDIPFYKDIYEQETQTVTAEYVKFQSSNTYPGSRKVFFESESSQFSMYVSMFTRDVTKLESGKTYEVEYFCNSYVIKSYKMIE